MRVTPFGSQLGPAERARNHDLRQDGQAGRVRAAAVRGPGRAPARGDGAVRPGGPAREGGRPHGLLAGGGRVRRLCDQRDPAGVAPCQIFDPEAAQVPVGELSVVSAH